MTSFTLMGIEFIVYIISILVRKLKNGLTSPPPSPSSSKMTFLKLKNPEGLFLTIGLEQEATCSGAKISRRILMKKSLFMPINLFLKSLRFQWSMEARVRLSQSLTPLFFPGARQKNISPVKIQWDKL